MEGHELDDAPRYDTRTAPDAFRSTEREGLGSLWKARIRECQDERLVEGCLRLL